MPPGIKGILCIKFDLFKIKYYASVTRDDRLSRDKLSMPPGIKGILCIKFDLFKIKNTAFWAAMVRKLKNCFTHYDAKHFSNFF